jgi:ceramide glucosyltransferase
MTGALHVVAGVLALLAVCGLGYQVLAIIGARRYLGAREMKQASFAPPISILKPLKGFDPEMYECFRSHCLQDYPREYEIIFGVNDASDAAIVAVKRLQQEFPDRDISLIVCTEVLGTNRKVSNLVQMTGHAKYEHLVINDSDIRVPSDYLRKVAASFADPQVGMVTALYRGVPHPGLWSKLEAVTISTDFAGGVLSAVIVDGGLHFALGSTLAISKTALKKIGGLRPIANHLADDYELGSRTAAAGLRVVLADVVVETFLPEYTFREMFQHQLRWARTIRNKRKWGYAGVLFTFGLAWAILAVLISGGAEWALAVLALVALARFSGAFLLSARVLHDFVSVRNLWMVPVRDLIGVTVWVASFTGNTVNWRGEKFQLKDGKLYRS